MSKNNPRGYTVLIDKLDRFIRKYYMNRLIKGSLLFVGLLVMAIIIASSLEYFFYFPTGVRKLLFFGGVLVGLIALYGWVLRPLLSYARLGSTISHEQAAEIIGTFFAEVQDKLLNILQLQKQLDQQEDSSLLLASIDQKTEELRPIQFRRAIDLSANRRYLKYAVPPLLLFGSLLIMSPGVLSEGGERILKNSQHFEPPAPFHFLIDQGDQLQAIQDADYEVLIKTTGDVVPQNAFIEFDNRRYELTHRGPGLFSFVWPSIQSNIEFRLTSGKVISRPYDIEVMKKPKFRDMQVQAVYPSYIGRRSELFKNTGDLTVPAGTQLHWKVSTSEASQLEVLFDTPNDDLVSLNSADNQYQWTKRALTPIAYTLFISNDNLPRADSMQFAIDVIPDLHPHLRIEPIVDSTSDEYSMYIGSADDDYGLTALNVVYQIIRSGQEADPSVTKNIQPVSGLVTSFEYLFAADSFDLMPGDQLSYHFEVWDNDAVRGPKMSKSATFFYKKKSYEELEQVRRQNNQDIKKTLEENRKKSAELRKEFEKLREKLLNKKELNWQDKKDLEKLQQKQNEIQQSAQEALKKMQENKQNQQSSDEALQEKQDKLEDLMKEAMNEDMQKLMEDIQKLLEEMQREQALDQIDEMNQQSESQEMEYDRLLELYKQLEVEQELQKTIDKLNQLADEQMKLSEDTQSQEKPLDELKEKQEQLSEQFKDLEKNLEDVKEKNKELQNPHNIDDTEKIEEDIKDEQKKSEKALNESDDSDQNEQDASEKNSQESDGSDQEENPEKSESSSPSQKQKAAQSQKSASEKMKKMSEQLNSGMMSGSMAQMSEDLELIRQLLENILNLSFEQEDLVGYLNQTDPQSNRYVALVRDQNKIKDDFSIVQDSLQALSKRNDQIQSFIMEKVRDINKNLKKSITLLEDRQKDQSIAPQRYTMTYLNDLALMLSESMKNMQQQMSSMMTGSQMCNNPKPGDGQGSKPMDVITKGQGKIKEGLDNMKGKMNGGEQPTAEEFGKMAQQQAAMRKMLQDLQQQNSEQGQNSQLLQEIIDAMNNQEKDLVNKQLTNETLKRQQEIETRLLEAEKAERQRDLDDERESKTADEIVKKLPPNIEAYLKERTQRTTNIERASPLLNPYYKRLVDLYYKSLYQ